MGFSENKLGYGGEVDTIRVFLLRSLQGGVMFSVQSFEAFGKVLNMFRNIFFEVHRVTTSVKFLFIKLLKVLSIL